MTPVLVAILVAIGVGSLALVGDAAAIDTTDDQSERTIASIELEMSDERFTIHDVDMSGTGLPDAQIEERTYTIEEATRSADGVSFEFQSTTYTICAVDIVIQDVSVGLENISLSSDYAGSGRSGSSFPYRSCGACRASAEAQSTAMDTARTSVLLDRITVTTPP